MESFISAILLGGVLLSSFLVLSGLILHKATCGHWAFRGAFQGSNVWEIVLADFKQISLRGMEGRFLIHFGFCALLLTPYIRVLASLFYFAYVERTPKHALLSASVFCLLSYILFWG